MGMDLSSTKSNAGFRCNLWTWGMILDLAYQYGWEPLGTEEPGWDFYGDYLKEHGWDGSYLSNDGQLVRSEDAKAMADALELALADMYDPRTPEEHETNDVAKDPVIVTLCEGFRGQETDFEERYNPIALLRYGGREKLEEFIDFCQKGAFFIL